MVGDGGGSHGRQVEVTGRQSRRRFDVRPKTTLKQDVGLTG